MMFYGNLSTHITFLASGLLNGSHWHTLKLKKDLFAKDVAKGSTDLHKYGKILISGFGQEPTEDAKAYLWNEFGLKAL